VDESKPFLPGQPFDAGTLALEHDSDTGDDDLLTEPNSRVGGLWVSCHEGFRRSGEPDKDVTRLAMMCGPPNGMVPIANTMRGSVVAGGRPASHDFSVQEGACYRIFAVGGGDIGELDVIVTSGRGTHLATDDSRDAWPIVERDRPLCSFGDDTFRIEVSSRRGAGPYSVQIWSLPPR